MGLYKDAFSFYDGDADLILTIPRPPSVNAAYGNATKGRIKSRRYIEWLVTAKSSLWGKKFSLIRGKVYIVYSLRRPDKRKRDAANFEKAMSDFFVKMGIIEDDSLVESNTQRWSGEVGNDVVCEIFAVGGASPPC